MIVEISLAELFPNFKSDRKGIFESIYNQFVLPWSSDSVTINHEYLDILLLTNYGSRIISPLLEWYVFDNELPVDSVSEIARIIWMQCKDKWKKTWEVFLGSTYDPISSYQIRYSDDSNGNSKDKIYAFNSEDGNDSGSNESSANSSGSRVGNVGNITIQRMISEEMELRKRQFYDSIVSDVADILTITFFKENNYESRTDC